MGDYSWLSKAVQDAGDFVLFFFFSGAEDFYLNPIKCH